MHEYAHALLHIRVRPISVIFWRLILLGPVNPIGYMIYMRILVESKTKEEHFLFFVRTIPLDDTIQTD